MAYPAQKICPELNRVAGFMPHPATAPTVQYGSDLRGCGGAYCCCACLRAWAELAVQLA